MKQSGIIAILIDILTHNRYYFMRGIVPRDQLEIFGLVQY